MSRTGQVLQIQRLASETITVPSEHKDDLKGSIKSRWVPATFTLRPVVVREITKPDVKVKGAYLTVQDEYYVISGYGSPTEGKHSKGTSPLDFDEMTSLQSAITYMQDTAKQWRLKNPSDDTILRFKSKDGLNLETEQDDDTKKIVFVLTSDGTSTILGDEQLAAFSGKLSQALDELKRR